jgi:hypothetical protein
MGIDARVWLLKLKFLMLGLLAISHMLIAVALTQLTNHHL